MGGEWIENGVFWHHYLRRDIEEPIRNNPDTIQTPSRHHQTPYRYPKLDCRMGVGWIEKGAGQVVSTEVWRIDLYRRVSFWRIDCRHKDSPRLSLSIQPRDQVSQAGQRICWFSGDDDGGGGSVLVISWYVVADMDKLQMYLSWSPNSTYLY